jgi:pilus assembly protein TadC
MLQMASGNTMLQTIVDDKQLGRVMSFYSVAKIIRNTILVGGIACILGALLFIRKLPEITNAINAHNTLK